MLLYYFVNTIILLYNYFIYKQFKGCHLQKILCDLRFPPWLFCCHDAFGFLPCVVL